MSLVFCVFGKVAKVLEMLVFPSCWGFCGVAYSCLFGFGRFSCFCGFCVCVFSFVQVLLLFVLALFLFCCWIVVCVLV